MEPGPRGAARPAQPAPARPRPRRPASPAARRGSCPATSSATRCAASTSSPRGYAGSTSSPPVRCPTGSTSTTRRSTWSTTARSCPADALPTFNSHAIETSLHLIPDLAEHFVYFNDDFFLGRPIRPEALFSPAGLPATFLAPTTIGLTDLPDSPPYLKAAWNNRRLLQGAFNRVLTHNLAHVPYPHRRFVLEGLTERFPDALAATARSPFRSDTDVSTLSSLAQHYGLMTGTSFVGEASRAYVNLSNSDLDWQLKKTLQREQDFICLADHHDHALNPVRLNRTLRAFMEAYFPVPAPWERPDA